MKREDVAVPASRCPACGYRMDSATCPAGERQRPREGDFAICLKCGVCLRFDRALRLVAATKEDIAAADLETRTLLALTTSAILELKRMRALQ